MRKISIWFLVFPATCLLTQGCLDKKDTEFSGTDSIFFDYSIIGREGDDNLTIRLKFRDDGEEWESPSLKLDGELKLDDEILTPDSAKMDGYFYEIHKPIESFAGNHTVTYTAIDGKKFIDSFEFRRFYLLAELPDTIPQSDLYIEVGGLKDGEEIEVSLTDTSFENGITRSATITKNQILVHGEELARLLPGPLKLELSKEENLGLRSTKAGGRFLIYYGLSRELFLRKTRLKTLGETGTR